MSIAARFLAPLAMAALLPVAASAAGGPAGQYVVDVETTYRALEDAGAATPALRDQLTMQRDVLILSFESDRFLLIAGAGVGGGVKGTCRWTAGRDALVFDNCQDAMGASFTIGGAIRYVAQDDMLMLEGDLPVPVRYRRQ